MSNPSIAQPRAGSKLIRPDFGAIAEALGFPYLHRRADGAWVVPSKSRAGHAYTVWLTGPDGPTCTCEHGRWAAIGHQPATCYHVAIALARHCAAPPPPTAGPARVASRARVIPLGPVFDARVRELFGDAA